MKRVAFAISMASLFLASSDVDADPHHYTMTDPPAYPQAERRLCDVSREYHAAVQAYQQMNAIKAAQVSAPDMNRTNDRAVALLGTSGAFTGWIGRMMFSAGGQYVDIDSTIMCSPRLNSLGYVFRGSVPIRSAIARTLSGLSAPGGTAGWYVRMSGRLAYRKGPSFNGFAGVMNNLPTTPDNEPAQLEGPGLFADFTSISVIGPAYW